MASFHSVQCCQRCPKGGGQVLCGGCQQWFCMKHLDEHRQELSQQMDDLTLEHDDLQQNLILNGQENDHEHLLRTRIDRWEVESITRIKHVADEIRQELRKLLRPMAHELKESRQMNNYTENDLEKAIERIEETTTQSIDNDRH